MNKRQTAPKRATKSPWLDPNIGNLFRDQFRLINDREIDPELKEAGGYFEPLPVFQWIASNSGQDLFFKGLARLAPMFPVMAYHNEIAVWTSPPPSGNGNVIFMVMGHDFNGKLRIVGGNYFTERWMGDGKPGTSMEFFTEFDKLNKREAQSLVAGTVMTSITQNDNDYVQSVIQTCEYFHTMPIFITVLTRNGSLFQAGAAVIEGDRPTDFSHEFFGEVK